MYINSFFILTPKKDNYKIREENFRYDNSIYEITYGFSDEINIYITKLKEDKINETKLITILLYKNVYIVLTNLYSDVENIRKLFRYKFNIESDIYCIDTKKYKMLIKKYKVNNIYVMKDNIPVNINIKNNREVYKYMDYIYSIVFIVKRNNYTYIVNIPKFGLFNIGYQSKEDVINVIEEMNLIND